MGKKLTLPNGSTIEFGEDNGDRLRGMEPSLIIIEPEGPEDEETAAALQAHGNWMLEKVMYAAAEKAGVADEFFKSLSPGGKFVYLMAQGIEVE